MTPESKLDIPADFETLAAELSALVNKHREQIRPGLIKRINRILRGTMYGITPDPYYQATGATFQELINRGIDSDKLWHILEQEALISAVQAQLRCLRGLVKFPPKKRSTFPGQPPGRITGFRP